MVTFLFGFPDRVPQTSMRFTTGMPSITRPNTTASKQIEIEFNSQQRAADLHAPHHRHAINHVPEHNSRQ
jgi:hypothetical protein